MTTTMTAGVCRVCGCTDDDCSGCVERTGEPCYWAEPNLCSACVRRSHPRWQDCPDCGGYGAVRERVSSLRIPVVCRTCTGRGGWLLTEPAPDAGDGYEVAWP
jgi:DnaJ-class molecular chaperone